MSYPVCETCGCVMTEAPRHKRFCVPCRRERRRAQAVRNQVAYNKRHALAIAVRRVVSLLKSQNSELATAVKRALNSLLLAIKKGELQ